MRAESWIKLSVCAAIAAGLAGCGSNPATASHDLVAIEKKVTAGMSETSVVAAAGTPNHVDAHGDYRDLRYNGDNGTYLVVSLKNNVVTSVVLSN